MSAFAEDEEYEEDFYEEEEWEQDAPSAAESGEWHPARESEAGHQRSLSLGIVAMAPLLLAYELGLATDAGLPRNLAELALFRALAPLGETLELVRPGVEFLGVALALVLCFKRRLALGPSVTRIVFEGVVGAVLIGPALAFSMRFFGGVPEELVSATSSSGTPELAAAARLFGGAAYEELLFRVLAYGGLYVLTRRVAMFFGLGERSGVVCTELLSVLGSSLAFAAFHLQPVAQLFGVQGESFSSPVFLWRTLAGILLAVLFRWRGPGVAAWTHALFNLALFLGAGVEVLL
jgi:Type II CAAX prenyl endopeptidase Rce1-like